MATGKFTTIKKGEINFLFYTYYNGQVVNLHGDFGSRSIVSVLVGENKVHAVLSFKGGYAYWHEVYKIVNGALQEIASGTVYPQEDLNLEDFNYVMPTNEWNGREVTEEQFYALLNEVFDSSKEVVLWRTTVSYSEILNTLQNAMNN